jgi:SagB-type dehydrogenase family enzyme
MKSLLLSLLVFFAAGYAQETNSIKLLPPQKETGKPLMQVLNQRQSQRSFSKKDISEQDLSNILWAAFGINRSESGKRTAPSAMNKQEIDVYAVMKDGAYLYEPKTHSIKKISDKDIRNLTGIQSFVKDAPLNLVYVADYSKVGEASKPENLLYIGADAGFIAENVYLYCASENLATVVRGSLVKDKLAKELKLNKNQNIILAQTVGYGE